MNRGLYGPWVALNCLKPRELHDILNLAFILTENTITLSFSLHIQRMLISTRVNDSLYWHNGRSYKQKHIMSVCLYLRHTLKALLKCTIRRTKARIYLPNILKFIFLNFI